MLLTVRQYQLGRWKEHRKRLWKAHWTTSMTSDVKVHGSVYDSAKNFIVSGKKTSQLRKRHCWLQKQLLKFIWAIQKCLDRWMDPGASAECSPFSGQQVDLWPEQHNNWKVVASLRGSLARECRRPDLSGYLWRQEQGITNRLLKPLYA